MTSNLLKPDKPKRQPKEGSKEAGLREMRQRVIDEEIPAFCQAAKRKPAAQHPKPVAAAKILSAAQKLDAPKGGIDPDFAKTEAAKEKLRVLERKARKLDAKGKAKEAAKVRAAKAALAAISPELLKSTAVSAEPVTAAAVEPKESEVRTNLKTKPAAKTKTRRSTDRRKRPAPARKPNGGPNKSDIVEQMLLSKNGATRAELSKASGWPNVNLKTAAERAKKKLVENDGHFRLIAK